MPARGKSNGRHVRDNGTGPRRIAERNWRDELIGSFGLSSSTKQTKQTK